MTALEPTREAATEEERPGEVSGRRSGTFWEQANTLILAVLIALLVRAFVIEPFRIPSESMLPTLLIGDHLFVNKFLYGPRIPFTDIRLPGLREPRRGDVIVFTVGRRGPAIIPLDREKGLRREEFVKRIVGLPGDVIEFRQGRLYVNGERVVARPLGESFRDEGGRTLDESWESLGVCGHRLLDDADLSRPDPPPFQVEEGRYFMMGDNRDYSNDSRGWGTVRLDEIKGPAFILYWSWNWNGNWFALANPLTWGELLTGETRWARIGDRVGCGAESPEGLPPA